MAKIDKLTMRISEGVIGWECFCSDRCQYLTTREEWVDGYCYEDDACTAFDSRNQIDDLLDSMILDESLRSLAGRL